MSHRPAHAYHPSAELDLEDEMRDAFQAEAAEQQIAAARNDSSSHISLNLHTPSGSSMFSPPSSVSSSVRRGSMCVGSEDVSAQEVDYTPIDFGSPSASAAAAIATPVKSAMEAAGAPWLQPTPNGAASDAAAVATARRPNGTPHSAVRIRTLSVEADPAKSAVPLAALPAIAIPAAASPASPASVSQEPRFGSLGVYAALIGAQLCWSGFHLFAKVAFDYMHPVSEHSAATASSESVRVLSTLA